MSGTVSTRWYWSDWMSDPGLRACGYAARGLWKDMLCIAGSNKGKDYGFVTLNGRPLDAAGIARMTGGTLAEVETLLAELDRNGVFSRDRRKVIYCRRMVRAEKNRGNGRLGGNPNLTKTRDNSESVQPRPKAPIPEPEPEPVPVKKKPAPFRDGLFVSDWPDDYRDEFWRNYPRKTEKKAAMAKLDAVRKSGTVAWAPFMAGVLRHLTHVRATRTEERYVKHPATWLNRGCWEDEYAAPGSAPAPRNAGGGFAEARRQLRERARGDRDAADASVEDDGPTLPAGRE